MSKRCTSVGRDGICVHDAEQLRRAAGLPLVLASASPRRADLLRQVGIAFEVQVSEVVEDAAASEAGPAAVAAEHARKKALAVSAEQPDRFVLGADTVVVCNGSLLGKPESEEQAEEMLRLLSGRTHEVITAVALAFGGTAGPAVFAEDQVRTRVVFRELSDEEIDAYVATGEPMDKAGAYGIQERGALLVDRIDGCYFNVVGLPLSRMWELLRGRGLCDMCGWMNGTGH